LSPLNPSALYCAYLRKSRKDVELEALGQGETLARHEKQLRDLADRLGVSIAETYREIVSGDTIAERPEVRRLLDDVAAGLWAGVLVMDVDRLGRGDSIDQGVIMQTFLYSGTLIITPDKTYDPADESDSEFFEIKLFFSRREYNMIKKRMQRGRVAAALAGCYSSPRAVFGYERYKLPDRKGWSLRPVPEKAEIVRMVYRWYADGVDGHSIGTSGIASRLIDMGVKTDLGGNFSPSSVRQMLQNPTYIGKIQWNTRTTVNRIENGRRVRSRPRSDRPILVDGLHEPIVDAALFARVQDIFSHHGKWPGNVHATPINPLAGLLYCGVCGHAMTIKGDPNRRGDFVVCKTQRCASYSAYLSVVEGMVLEILRGWIVDYETARPDARQRADDRQTAAATVRQLTAQLQTLETQSGRLFDLLESGVYDVATYRQRRADLDSRLAQTREALDQARKPSRPAPLDLYIPKLRQTLSAYAAASTPAEKNALLKQVVERITYHKTQRCYRNNGLADHLTLDVFPKYPDPDGDN